MWSINISIMENNKTSPIVNNTTIKIINKRSWKNERLNRLMLIKTFPAISDKTGGKPFGDMDDRVLGDQHDHGI